MTKAFNCTTNNHAECRVGHWCECDCHAADAPQDAPSTERTQDFSESKHEPPHPSNTEQSMLKAQLFTIIEPAIFNHDDMFYLDRAITQLADFIATHTAEAVREALAKHVLAGMPELTPRQQEYITKVLEEL